MTTRQITDDDLDARIRIALHSATAEWHAPERTAVLSSRPENARGVGRPRWFRPTRPDTFRGQAALVAVALVVAAVGIGVGRSLSQGGNQSSARHPSTPVTHPTPIPSPPLPVGELNGVWCAAAGDCWAVGGSGAEIEHYTGGGWAVVDASSDGSVLLNGVTCASAGDCWAVGGSGHGSPVPLIEHYAGSDWAAVATPNNGPGLLMGTTCTSAADCWAVGYLSDVTGNHHPLIEHDAGSGWASIVSPATGTPGPSQLNDVACTRAGDCWAVGYAGDTSEPLIEHYTSGSWTIVSTANRGPSLLMGVTCVSAGNCWAAGGSDSGTAEPLIEHYTGSRWAVVSTPQLTSGSSGHFNRVTCASAGDCWAVGLSRDGSIRPLIEHFDGSGWAVVSTAIPGQGVVNGVSCASTTDCWAVGLLSSDTTQPLTNIRPLIEHNAGSSWSVANPTGS
jgi:hypothetical protein